MWGDEKGSDSVSILKIDTIGFADGLNKGVREDQPRVTLKVLDLKNQKIVIAFYRDGGRLGGSGFGERLVNTILDMLDVGCL